MGRTRLNILIMLGVCLLTALPVVAAVFVARQQATERENRMARQLASLLLSRADVTATQIAQGERIMRSLPEAQACGPRGLATLQRIDLESTMFQAVGHIRGNTIVCSSFAGREAIDIGPANFVTRLGVRDWTAVRLVPGGPPMSVASVGSFAAVVHNDLPLSFVSPFPGLALGVFNVSHGRVLLSRDPDHSAGKPPPPWTRLAPGIYRQSGRIVAVVHSRTHDLGAYAAMPAGQARGIERLILLVLIPVALLSGALASLVFVRLLRARTSMPGLIRWGLRNGEFHVMLQPVIDLASGTTVGAEALVRWVRASGEVVPPDTFIPVAEAAGAIRPITREVLRLVEPHAARLVALNPAFRLSINFSADDIHFPGIVGEVERFLARARLPAANLVIEATERSFVDAERARATLDALRDAGVTIAIDDFGTGYSSLGYLARLEVDCIKIDRLFVQSLGTESATSQVAARIIDMARDLGVTTVAEGVETVEQARMLRSLGVTCVQGYLYGEPLDFDALAQRLAEEFAHPVPAPAITSMTARAAA